MAQLIAPGRSIRLQKGRSNAGVAATYRKHLTVLIRRMHRDTLQTIRAHYRRAEPEIALDANPLTALQDALEQLQAKWRLLFNAQGAALAGQFVERGRSDAEADLRRRLKRAGFGITFKPSATLRRQLEIATQYNVRLITSIGEQYQQGINALVTEAVMAGGDLGALTKKLQSRCGVSERKAAFIATDQNNKISQFVERQRASELGLKEAYWRHVCGGRFSREDHRRADGMRYDIAKGCFISGQYIQPGQLVNCRCRAEYIIPGYNDWKSHGTTSH
ncbi:hypothetical protein GS537_06650 [Saccharibacter sp. EH60]|uniref:phage minor head protein n=2 Tax=Saccharibacter TaxID=231052 RepID=UPI00135DBDA2|nr:phage minor head protein [Saccharibacter sp. EH60]MXV65893.1 hypothetical protein [Saccharibacter sp. EH60]